MHPLPRPVLILHEAIAAGARADELDALVQVREVTEALRRLGVDTVVSAIGLDLDAASRDVRRHDPACVFNLVESLGGWGELISVVPSLLERIPVRFTGSGSKAIYLSSEKTLAKRLMASCGVATPEWFGTDERASDGRQRWIVKSVWEHASFGLDDSSVVRGGIAAREVMERRARELGGQWFAERYIEGREFNISLLERHGRAQVLPIAEMSFTGYPAGKPRIVGYAAKWDESADEYHATQRAYPRLDPALRDALRRTALECWDLFGLRGYARVDIRTDEGGRPWVLEVNANPCLSADAGFAAAAFEAGLSYDGTIECILRAGLPPEEEAVRRAG